jgi:hypothetical protein
MGDVHKDWKDIKVKLLFKKGDKSVLDNYRGISLMSHAAKIMERMLLERLMKYVLQVEGAIPDTQFGFMKDKGVVDALAISRQLASLTINLDGGTMFRCYVDLVKAYDRVNRLLMWELLKRYGVPESVVSVIQSFHDGAQARVRLQGEYSESFALETGLKQGSPTLFNVFLGAIVQAARKEYVDSKLGIPINAKAFWDLLGRRKTHHQQRKRLTEILFADDMELVAKSASDLQAMLSIFDRIARTFGQLISAKKSKVMVIKRGQE